ncbi:uncharacterized protein LOC131228765 [Magnolia sinica]|uniref:uncharacterized protein LOC131228765 n=1 Tax=Magnolia sinica TaxID=86752 RepID=UPI002657AD2A|nr:uncharacterized protein LOC131228765 [Magnolia sinica]
MKQSRDSHQIRPETKASPFVEEVMRARLPERFRLSQITPFTGKTDPTHIECFRTYMELHDALDAVMCRAFSLTLADVARLWFKQLKPKSISTFGNSATPSLPISLSLQVRKYSEETALNFIMQGVRDKPFLASLDKSLPETLAEFMTRSDKYADVEETRNLREVAQNAKTPTKESAKKEVNSTGGKKCKDDRTSDEHKSSKRPDQRFSTYTLLNKPQEQVLMEIKSKGFISWLNKL